MKFYDNNSKKGKTFNIWCPITHIWKDQKNDSTKVLPFLLSVGFDKFYFRRKLKQEQKFILRKTI